METGDNGLHLLTAVSLVEEGVKPENAPVIAQLQLMVEHLVASLLDLALMV